MNNEYIPFWNCSSDEFAEKHVAPLDNMLINQRANELIREGESPHNAYNIARNEYLEKQLNGFHTNTRPERTSTTAVVTVPNDAYKANLPVPTQMNNSMQMTILQNGKMISRVMNPADAGVSFEDAQSENYEQLKDKRELSRRKEEFEQDLDKKKRENELELQHKRALKEIEDKSASVDLNTGQILPAGMSAVSDREILLDMLHKFAVDKRIVLENKRRDTDDVVVYMWNEDEFIYFKISLQRLRTEIKEFFYKNGWTESFPATDNKVAEYADMIKTIVAPTLDKSGLKIADGNQTFFPNGYYDIRKGEFIACNTKGIFHTFCIPYDFDENAPDPEKFDEILNQTFVEDKDRVPLMYQVIGALISDVRSLKYIYVFQGGSHCGKTTVAAIILRLLDKKEVKKLNTVNEITGDNLKRLAKSFKVVCIRDSGQEALRVNSVSYLKSYTAGDIDEDDVYFTMLLQTNNPIYSDKAGNVEKALQNRLLVVPFEHDFSSSNNDNSLHEEQDDVAEIYKNNYFDKEKQGIVRKALEALQGVMKNGRRFIHRYPLNDYVGKADAPSNALVMLNEPAKDKGQLLKEFIEKHYDLVDAEIFHSEPKNGTDAPTFFKIVSMMLPNIFANSSSLGKTLKDITVFGKQIESKDFSDTRYYNIKLDT